jgi:YesN/AraC family two-component response regulator
VDSAVECTKLGAFKYLEKPYDFEKLVDALKEAYHARLQKKFESNRKDEWSHSEDVHCISPHWVYSGKWHSWMMTGNKTAATGKGSQQRKTLG